jgi:glycosyltransferase involved in cell wall biosynthesis
VNKPLVSITLGVKNGADTIRSVIESVLAQTYTNWELIIRDNCSTDDTVSIIKSFTDPRIRLYINEYDKGAFINSSSLTRMASGEYMKSLDDDNILYPECLEKQVRILSARPDIVFVTSDTEYITPSGKIISARVPFKKDVVTRDEYIKFTLLTGRGSIQEGCQSLWRTAAHFEAVEKFFSIGLADGLINIYSSYFYKPSLWLTKGDMYVIHETLSSGRIEANSASLQFNQAKLQGDWIRLLIKEGYRISPLLYITARIMIFARATARRLTFSILGRPKCKK